MQKREFNLKDVCTVPDDTLAGLTMHDLRLAAGSRFATWVFDLDFYKVVWANEQALLLWKAETEQELYQRSMHTGLSTSAKQRLAQYQVDIRAGKKFDELWTLYPKGAPCTIDCSFRGITLADGRIAMLCEAGGVASESFEMTRKSQALLYTSAMVSLFSDTGKCLYANPAARQSHIHAYPTLADRLCSKEISGRLLRFSEGNFDEKFFTTVVTTQGMRIHEVDARVSYDAATGQHALYLTEIDITEREKAKQDLAHAANHDALTGLKNRTGFTEIFQALLQDDTRSGAFAALFFLDIDRFKNVNDTMGHCVGDELLVAVAQRLTATLSKTCVTARFGGDEFLVLLPSCKDIGEAQEVGNRIISSFARPVFFNGKEIRISASIGISAYPKDGTSIDDLLLCADLALYQAKDVGGNQIEVFEPYLAERLNRFVELEIALRNALKNDGFELYFQPRVEIATRRITGAEGLLRLITPETSNLNPSEFIPVAEATGLINEIGIWVLKEAARNQVKLRQMGRNIKISVNISAQQFCDPDLIPCLKNIVHMPAFEPWLFELEITESILVSNDIQQMRVMKEISELGFKFAIDDFGTAFSNLAALQKYPIECIKIDGSLIQADNFKAIVRGAITIGLGLGVNIVAEGVETENQRLWLQQSGCREFQGFLFSKALPFKQLTALLSS